MDVDVRSFDFTSKDYEAWKSSYDYHYLYILENGKEAYIGETGEIEGRSGQHHQPSDYCRPFNFLRIHVITSREFEATPAKHFERLLIRLMAADQKFRIVNDQPGQRTNYGRKNDFELCFDKLWLKLEEMSLVKHKDFYQVLNSCQYKYSPYTELTKAQYEALTSIVHTIDSNETKADRRGFLNRPILVEGDAGTGKTVVAVSLFHYLKTHNAYKDLKIALVYANPPMREEIKSVFQSVNGLDKRDVISPIDATKQHYDILICDEAQRLRTFRNLGMYSAAFKKGNARLGLDEKHDELDWLLSSAKCLVLFSDSKQIVCPSDIPRQGFYGRLHTEKRGVRPIELKEQMRIRAGNKYVPYIHDLLFGCQAEPAAFPSYDFKLFESFLDMKGALEEKERKLGLCRMCSGYGWKWISKDQPNQPDIKIEGCELWWNCRTGGWVRDLDASKELGSVYSLSGLDLNYTAVVFGPDVVFDKEENKIKVNKEQYFDNKVKRSSTDEELHSFLLNTYGVLMTRGICGTYLYAADPALREYLSAFVPFVPCGRTQGRPTTEHDGNGDGA